MALKIYRVARFKGNSVGMRFFSFLFSLFFFLIAETRRGFTLHVKLEILVKSLSRNGSMEIGWSELRCKFNE